MFDFFLNHLRTLGWQVERLDRPVSLPEAVTVRALPPVFLDWLHTVRRVVRSDETAWFLCAEDYAGHTGTAFRWNEWELLSLESAGGDAAWRREIRGFWERHFPILLSVDGTYAYYAIDLEDGSIVCGEEPEFEECSVIASSFPAFLEDILCGRSSLSSTTANSPAPK